MSGTVQPIRGMNDVLPSETACWQRVEDCARGVFEAYGYTQIRVPLLEYTSLFQRSIGDTTDIVEKEMYTFDDRNGKSLTLRPEATAGIVRAGITHGLLHNQRQKLWTAGPMFRHENPQKGRYRQFHQLDCEAIGYEGPDVDAEVILMPARMLRELGIERIELEINSLGTPESRQAYRGQLVDYFSRYERDLDEDSRRRLGRNPMRILDSKNPAMGELVAGAPSITDCLDAGSQAHFDSLCDILDATGLAYRINPRLVRGLDYYTRTVFEWVTDALGAQGAVCAGGRYDGLVEHLGGRATPAIGWAMGIERLVELYRLSAETPDTLAPHVYTVAVGDAAVREAIVFAERLRDAAAGLRVEINFGGGSFKSQLKRADKSGAAFALIIGDDELARGEVGIKPLRSRDEQQTLARDAHGVVDALGRMALDSAAL